MLNTVSLGQGARARRSFTNRRDVNLQPEIMSLVRGVWELKRKERNRDQWVPINMGPACGTHTA